MSYMSSDFSLLMRTSKVSHNYYIMTCAAAEISRLQQCECRMVSTKTIQTLIDVTMIFDLFFLSFLLPSDNVQHDLQLGSLIAFPKKKTSELDLLNSNPRQLE